jgi:hypothetical protein
MADDSIGYIDYNYYSNSHAMPSFAQVRMALEHLRLANFKRRRRVRSQIVEWVA